MAQVVKNPPVMWEMWIWFLGWEDPLEQEKATDSSSLAWGISWTEEPGGHSPWSLRVGRDWADTHARLRNSWAKPPAPCSRRDSGCCDQEPCLASSDGCSSTYSSPEMLLVFSRNFGCHRPTANFPLSFHQNIWLCTIQSPAQEQRFIPRPWLSRTHWPRHPSLPRNLRRKWEVSVVIGALRPGCLTFIN